MGQIAYAVMPATIAMSVNLANRYRRLQQAGERPTAAIAQVQDLRGELNSVRDSLQVLPLTQRLQDLEAAIAQMRTTLVQIQRHQQIDRAALEQAMNVDRETVKEAFTILKRGLHNLYTQVGEDLQGMRQEVESAVRLPRDSMMETQSALCQRLESAETELSQLHTNLDRLTAGSQSALVAFGSDLDRVQQQIDRMEQLDREVVQPGVQQLVQTVKQLQQQAASESEAPAWVKDLDRRLSVALDAQYQLVWQGYGEWLLKALEQAQTQVIIIAPHVSRHAADYDRILAGLTAALDRGLAVTLAWGDRTDIGPEEDTHAPITRKSKGWDYHRDRDLQRSYSALADLVQLKQRYPNLRLKLSGSTKPLLMCDRTWILLGGQSVLGYPAVRRQLDVGLYTTDPNTIFSWVTRLKSSTTHR
jgi:predicted nuclease with TOPRIM domain